MAAAWVIRAGKLGEREQWAIDCGLSGGGWKEVPDLTVCSTRDQVVEVVKIAFPGAPEGRLSNYTGQLWGLRGRIAQDDLLVMPMKTTKQIALGRVTGGYIYRPDEDPNRRHVVRVEWQRTDLPRTSVKQDLLFTLGSAMSVFAPSKNKAVQRLEHLLAHGTDPGAVTSGGLDHQPASSGLSESAVDEPEVVTDIAEFALDQITGRVAEEFAGHGLAVLVSAVLEAEGFECIVSPPGPDGGIDITAGRGPLGLDSPRLLVQVKSGSQIGSPVVTQLHGVMTTHGADQGLLVAWGGLSKPARDALKNQQLRVRIWEAADVVEAVLHTYDRLPVEIREQLPLRRVWMLSDAGL